MTAPTLRAALATPGAFPIVVEVVPSRGPLSDGPARRGLAAARALVDDSRVVALSITDGAGGHATMSPLLVADEFVARDQDVVVHVACRDRSRNALLTLGWELGARGIRNVLAVSGDYPAEGTGGLSRPTFDVDSVGLIALLRTAGGDHTEGDGSVPPGLFIGAAVSPFKRLEAETIPQYLKLGLKACAGADFVIPQLGYDTRKWDELLRWMRRHDIRLPVLANVYVLSATIARLFHANRIPGCVVSDELLAACEREGGGLDRGRAFFLELAAKQVAIARGMGFAGAYLAGSISAGDVDRILTTADRLTADWPALAREVQYARPGTFYVYARDPVTGLHSDELDRRYARSLTPAARGRLRRRAPVAYRLSRLTHDAAFTPGTPGFAAAARVYEAVDGSPVDRPLHIVERTVKAALFGCRDCGDCALPDVAYLCPEANCPKGERNGPCGGSADGLCEVEPRRCVWVRAYERLKPYGEELTMLERDPILIDNALRGSSAWANTYLGRDYRGRRSRLNPAADGHGAHPATPRKAKP